MHSLAWRRHLPHHRLNSLLPLPPVSVTGLLCCQPCLTLVLTFPSSINPYLVWIYMGLGGGVVAKFKEFYLRLC